MSVETFYDKTAKEALDTILLIPMLHQFHTYNFNQLRLFAQEFHVFVDYFPKYLGALIWKSPYETLRLTIIDNLIDESGGLEKIEAIDTSKTHPQDFRNFAYRLNLQDEQLFNMTKRQYYTKKMLLDLNDLSKDHLFYTALGGIAPGIENIFHIWISKIYNGLKQHDFFNNDDLSYFSSHAILDIEHGKKFKKSIISILTRKEQQEALRQGALRMANIVYEFFQGLSEDFKKLSTTHLSTSVELLE